MTTLTLDRVSEQGAIANSLGFAKNNLFASTNQAIDFWLEALRKRENLPKKEYLEYLSSFGWSNRNASSYLKMADFIRCNLMEYREAIARLDIRTLIKLPRIRYASIVEAIKEYAPTQKQISDLIKKLPPAPRGYKSAEQKQDEVFEVNVPAATGAVITEAAELLGLSNHSLILLGAKLVRALAQTAAGIAASDESLMDLMQEVQVKVAQKSCSDEEDLNGEQVDIAESLPVVDEQSLAQQELDAYIEEQQPEIPLDAQSTIPFDFAKNRIAELTINLQKVNTAIALLIEEGHEEDSLSLMSAKQRKAVIMQELDIWGSTG